MVIGVAVSILMKSARVRGHQIESVAVRRDGSGMANSVNNIPNVRLGMVSYNGVRYVLNGRKDIVFCHDYFSLN